MLASKIRDPMRHDRPLGAHVKKLRKQNGLTQTQLGDALGLTFQQIQKYESAKNRMSYSTVVKIAHYFGQSVDQFLAGVDDFNAIDPKNRQATGPTRVIPLLFNFGVQELVMNYVTLSLHEQEAVADFVKKMSSKQEGLAA